MSIDLKCGDSYELIKDIPTNSIDLVIIDPPYQFDMAGGGGCFGTHKRNYHAEYVSLCKLERPFEEKEIVRVKSNADDHRKQLRFISEGFTNEILDELVRVMKKINIYIWCNKEQIYDYMTYFVKEKKCNFEIIVWAKPNPAPFTNGHYLKDKEYCLFFWEKGVKLNGDYHSLKTYYIKNTNVEDKDNFLHPTIKPIDIIENLIRNSCGGGVNS